MPIRQPIVAVLGHVDHGKTTLLDRVRGTAVAAREPGAITQHIGASLVPASVIARVAGSLLERFHFKVEIPGLLFIDTPGHAAFSNLRRRGGSVADIAILVVDLVQGVQPQTVESLEILKARKTPFVVAATKLDLIPGWRSQPERPFVESVLRQEKSVQLELDARVYGIVGDLSRYKLNSERLDRVSDFKKTVAIIPLSARSGEGIADLLAVLAGLTQQFMKEKLAVSEAVKGTVLEVVEDVGLGVNVNAIIYDGVLREGAHIVVGGKSQPIVTKIRALLMPKPLDEIRDPRERFKRVEAVAAAAGVKIVAPGLEDALPGGPIYSVTEAEAARLAEKVKEEIESVKVAVERLGVVVKADTLGSLEALVTELERGEISVRLGDVGDVSRRDVLEASAVARDDPLLGVVLAFNVKVLPDAEEEALKSRVRVFRGDVLYRLLEEYVGWIRQAREEKARRTLESLVRPGKLRLLPGCVFRRSAPAIVGVEVLAGRIRPNVALVRENGEEVARILQIQERGQSIPEAARGMQVAISMREPTVGRHVREGETLYVAVPEEDVAALVGEFQSELSPDEVGCLKEYVAVARKVKPYFALGSGL